jgi:hypothetical protein
MATSTTAKSTISRVRQSNRDRPAAAATTIVKLDGSRASGGAEGSTRFDARIGSRVEGVRVATYDPAS